MDKQTLSKLNLAQFKIVSGYFTVATANCILSEATHVNFNLTDEELKIFDAMCSDLARVVTQLNGINQLLGYQIEKAKNQINLES